MANKILFPDSELVKHMAQIAEWRHEHAPPGLYFSSVDELLLSPETISEFWVPTPPTPEYEEVFEQLLDNPEFCQLSACYRNSALAALVQPDVAYAEGYAMGGMVQIPFQHAWNVLPDGTVVDCTWCGRESHVGTSGLEYIGVIVPQEVVMGWVDSGEPVGLFDWKRLPALLTEPPDWLFTKT